MPIEVMKGAAWYGTNGDVGAMEKIYGFVVSVGDEVDRGCGDGEG